MTTLAFTRAGAGAPLVLLHGLGSSRDVWEGVIPALAEQYDVLAVDLPGFGDSVPMPAAVEPSPAALAAAVAGLLDELGVIAPHVVGNSLGGWVALELAHIRPAASLTLLSPAGMWRRGAPLYCRASLRFSRWAAVHAAGPVRRLMSYRTGRLLVLRQSHGRPGQMSAERARAAVRDMGSCPGFDATLKATAKRRYLPGPSIDAPVTVAFGSRDLVLLKSQGRFLDQLPPDTHVGALPGCGHVPMADDPEAVTALISASAERGTRVPARGLRSAT
jgi:pimeloyl-ACP methyl ester carboxylesterase